jgi:hypothetical protein
MMFFFHGVLFICCSRVLLFSFLITILIPIYYLLLYTVSNTLDIMENDSGYLTSLIAKLYENTTSSFNFATDFNNEDDAYIKKEETDTDNDNSTSCEPDSKKRKVGDEEEEFFKNSSAAIIAESTEKTLKQMNIDPGSKEGKMQRRKIRNRMSAQIHRERKKAYIDYLEEKVCKRDEVITILQTMLKASQLENEQLRSSNSGNNGNMTPQFCHETVKCNNIDPLPMTSPAESNTSAESDSYQPDESTTSQSSTSPEHEIDHDYFSDFDVDGGGGGDLDSMFFSADNASWLPQQYQDLGGLGLGLGLDLDSDQCLDEDLMKLPLQGGAGGGGSLSMFSIVMMMGFSFFTGIVSMGTMGGSGSRGASSVSLFGAGDAFGSSSFMLQPWTLHPTSSSFATGTNMGGPKSSDDRVDFSYGLLTDGREDASNGASGGEGSEEDSSFNVPVGGGGRVLMSLPASSDDHDDDKDEDEEGSSEGPSDVYRKYNNKIVKSQNSHYAASTARSSATLSSLWRQQNYHFIGNIFPAPRVLDRGDNHSTKQNNKNRKYLRFRTGNGSDDNISPVGRSSVKEEDKQTDSSQADKMSVTVYQQQAANSTYNGHDSSSGHHGHGSEEDSSASPLSSKVLLSEGRVLLNPLLADLRTGSSSKDSSSGGRSSDYNTDRAIIPSVPEMFRHSTSDGSTSDDSGGSKLLTMMIPASSIQWGFEWGDETSPDNSDLVMKHLLKNFNLTTSVTGSSSSDNNFTDQDHDDGAQSNDLDISKLWLEIGCNVLQAKLVQSIL